MDVNKETCIDCGGNLRVFREADNFEPTIYACENDGCNYAASECDHCCEFSDGYMEDEMWTDGSNIEKTEPFFFCANCNLDGYGYTCQFCGDLIERDAISYLPSTDNSSGSIFDNYIFCPRCMKEKELSSIELTIRYITQSLLDLSYLCVACYHNPTKSESMVVDLCKNKKLKIDDVIGVGRFNYYISQYNIHSFDKKRFLFNAWKMICDIAENTVSYGECDSESFCNYEYVYIILRVFLNIKKIRESKYTDAGDGEKKNYFMVDEEKIYNNPVFTDIDSNDFKNKRTSNVIDGKLFQCFSKLLEAFDVLFGIDERHLFFDIASSYIYESSSNKDLDDIFKKLNVKLKKKDISKMDELCNNEIPSRFSRWFIARGQMKLHELCQPDNLFYFVLNGLKENINKYRYTYGGDG